MGFPVEAVINAGSENVLDEVLHRDGGSIGRRLAMGVRVHVPVDRSHALGVQVGRWC